MAYSPTPNRIDSATLKASPTTFLTLPRELRHQILLETYEFTETNSNDLAQREDGYNANELVVDIRWLKQLIKYLRPGMLSSWLRISGMRRGYRLLSHVEKWTAVLRQVHGEVVEDMDYVVGKLSCFAELREALEAAKAKGGRMDR